MGEPSSATPVLLMRGVSKVYGRGETAVRAVDSVDLVVAKGEVLLITGPSGSGKTTLLMMAGGLLRPTSGETQIAGVSLQGLSDRRMSELRLRSVGFVFQSFNLLGSLTALENVEVVLEWAGVSHMERRRRARALLDELNLTHRAHHRPADLSGGEKQRVSIARALANGPPLVLADEPTANLDSQWGHEVMTRLRDIAKRQGRSAVIVSHDHRIREVADRVLWMEDGRLREIRTVRDPVCGMPLDESLAPVSLPVDGQVHYFCGLVCKNKFLAGERAPASTL